MSYVMPKYRRLTDNDRQFGPITIGHSTYRPWEVTIKSGEEEYSGCGLYLGALGWCMRIALPPIIKPWREWVDLRKYDWAKNDGYWDIHPREYGFRLNDGFLQVFLGPQTNESATTKSWCTNLPWQEWRFVGDRYYGLKGELVATWPMALELEMRKLAGWGTARAAQDALKASVPKVKFALEDFDGTPVTATCWIEESECHFGTGLFSWLAFFRRPRVRRSMRIDYDKEVGYEKGSWKGGMMGHGVDLEPGELHEAAMRRYCAAGVRNKSGISPLKFIGRVD